VSRRSPRSAFAAARAARQRQPAGTALLVIDNRPLQQAAWNRLAAARKRLAKATADLHRHENTDEPAFLAWTATTFPTLLTELRELAAQFAEKSRLIASIEYEAFHTGRSPAQVWYRRRHPPADGAAPDGTTASRHPGTDEPFGPRNPGHEPDNNPFGSNEYEELMKAFFAEHAIDPDGPEAAAFRENIGGFLGFAPTERPTPAADPAREIYRRLVQHLHPDRGGEWTPARARLWHEVQQAWATHDLDWLARLEAEWETAAEVLGPASPVGRLVSALREIDCARRDADRRVRSYRSHPAWRFSALADRRAALARRTEGELRQQIEDMRSALHEVADTFDYWEESYPPRRRARPRRGKPHRPAPPGDPDDLPF